MDQDRLALAQPSRVRQHPEGRRIAARPPGRERHREPAHRLDEVRVGHGELRVSAEGRKAGGDLLAEARSVTPLPSTATVPDTSSPGTS
ncbi:hypothetical protein ACFV2H_44220 [Streptomyces sp. NPDC059629]|uniref:hypothetical protein n=1 Tax=Streptomyces sp. NPDC059629 TaxID=3346889 RepID=UPI0036C33B0A